MSLYIDRWEEGYDQGYYEALRNALRLLAMGFGIGKSIQDIHAELRSMRDEAHELMLEHRSDAK